MRLQGFPNERPSAAASFDVRSLHRRNGRTKPQLAQRAENLDVILETAFAQRMPRDLARGVLANEPLFLALSHGNSFLRSLFRKVAQGAP